MNGRMEEAFEALEALPDGGRDALLLAGLLWDEAWREAENRADKAEFLLEHIRTWTHRWGMDFNMESAEEDYRCACEMRPPALVPWYADRMRERGSELADLRQKLTELREEKESLFAWGKREHMEAKEMRAEQRRLQERIRLLERLVHEP